MFGMLTGNPLAKYLTAALAAVLLLGGVYVKGRWDGSALTEAAVAEERHKWEMEVAENQSEYDAKITALAADYNASKSKYQAEINKLKKRKPGTVVIEKIVEVYIPAKTDTIVPKGFVDLHNTAAGGMPLSDKPKADAEQPSGKKLSDVGTTVATNYYQCNAIRSQLESLQAVVAEFQKKQKELTK